MIIGSRAKGHGNKQGSGNANEPGKRQPVSRPAAFELAHGDPLCTFEGLVHGLLRRLLRAHLFHRLPQGTFQFVQGWLAVFVHDSSPWTTAPRRACSLVRALCKAAATAPRLTFNVSAIS